MEGVAPNATPSIVRLGDCYTGSDDSDDADSDYDAAKELTPVRRVERLERLDARDDALESRVNGLIGLHLLHPLVCGLHFMIPALERVRHQVT